MTVKAAVTANAAQMVAGRGLGQRTFLHCRKLW